MLHVSRFINRSPRIDLRRVSQIASQLDARESAVFPILPRLCKNKKRDDLLPLGALLFVNYALPDQSQE